MAKRSWSTQSKQCLKLCLKTSIPKRCHLQLHCAFYELSLMHNAGRIRQSQTQGEETGLRETNSRATLLKWIPFRHKVNFSVFPLSCLKAAVCPDTSFLNQGWHVRKQEREFLLFGVDFSLSLQLNNFPPFGWIIFLTLSMVFCTLRYKLFIFLCIKKQNSLLDHWQTNRQGKNNTSSIEGFAASHLERG